MSETPEERIRRLSGDAEDPAARIRRLSPTGEDPADRIRRLSSASTVDDSAGVGRMLPNFANTASSAAQRVDLNGVQNALEESDARLGDSLEGDMARATGKGILKGLGKVGGREGEISPLQEQLVDRSKEFGPDVQTEVSKMSQPLHWRTPPEPGNFHPVEAISKLLEAPQRAVLAATNPEVKGFDFNNPANTHTAWYEAMKRSGEAAQKKGEFTPARAYTGVTEGLGSHLDALGGVLGAGLGGLSDLMSSGAEPDMGRKTPEEIQPPQMPNWQAMKDTAANPVKGRGGEMISNVITDPISYLGMGGTGSGPAVGGQMRRALKFSGTAKELLPEAVSEATKLGETMGSLDMPKQIEALGQKYGANPKEMQRIFGKNYEAAGKSGLELGFLGFKPKPVTDIAASLGVKLPENIGTKAIEAIRETTGGPGYLTPSKRLALETAARRAHASQMTGTSEGLKDYQENVAPLLSPAKEERETLNRYAIDPARGGMQLRPEGMTAQENQGAKALKSFYARQHEGLVGSELLNPEQSAANPITGAYTPRQFAPKDSGSWGDKLFGKKPMPLTREGGGPNPLKSRGDFGGVALGTEGIEKHANVRFDPHEIVTDYVPKVERAKANEGFKKYVADNFAQYAEGTKPPLLDSQGSHIKMTNSAGAGVYVPREVVSKADEMFGKTMRQGREGGVFQKTLDAFMGHFKKMALFPAPRYHINNMIGDSTLMFANGMMRNPEAVKWTEKVLNPAVKEGELLFQSPGGKAWTKGDFLNEAKSFNLNTESAGRFDVPAFNKGDQIKAMQQASERGAGVTPSLMTRAKREGLGATQEVLSGGVPGMSAMKGGLALAERWELESNLMGFAERLAAGDSPASAVKKLREAKPDYSIKGPATQLARRVMPFAQWTMEVAPKAPMLAARAPYAVNLEKKLIESSIGAKPGEIQDPPSEKQRERGQSVALGAGARNSVLDAISSMSGSPASKGLGVRATVRGPFAESVNPFLEGALGNPDVFLQMAGPLQRAALEYATKRDMLTGQDLKRPDAANPAPIFNAGTGPTALQGRPSQMTAARYLPPMALGQAPSMLLNQAFGSNTSPAVGMWRPYSELGDQRQAAAWLNFLGGMPLYLTNPMSQYEHLNREGVAQDAKGIPGEIRKATIRAEKAKEAKGR